jgi:hypothetical protein
MEKLKQLIENLRAKDDVDAVFLTGSYGADLKPYSDIDLIIILKENTEKISSLYTWIDNTFADIFFFDHKDLNRIENTKELSPNNMDGIFVAWLDKATIQFDKSGIITKLKSSTTDLMERMEIPKSEKDSCSQKINYNFVANKRYFESGDTLYHEALLMRLLYSVSEIISGYFEFRDIPWRGEKGAVKYLKENDAIFYDNFLKYTKSVLIEEKFKYYTEMFQLVFTEQYKIWSTGDIFPQPKDRVAVEENELKEYWNRLIS